MGTADPASPTLRITAMCDAEGNVLVDYPPNLEQRLIAGAFLVMLVTGLFGYQAPAKPLIPILDLVFVKPWLVFLWLYWLVVSLVALVLHHPSLSAQRRRAVRVAAASFALVGAGYLFRDQIADLIKNCFYLNLLTGSKTLSCPSPAGLLKNTVTYAILNYVLLGSLFALGTWLWWRSARGHPFSPRVDLLTGLPNVFVQDNPPNPAEVATALLLAGVPIVLALALLMESVVPAVTRCHGAVTLLGLCSAADPGPLWLWDVAITLVVAGLGLWRLGILIQPELQKSAAPEAGAQPVAGGKRSVWTRVAFSYWLSILNVLLSPVRTSHGEAAQRVRAYAGRALGDFAWPLAMILAAGFCGELALMTQRLLHSPAAAPGCLPGALGVSGLAGSQASDGLGATILAYFGYVLRHSLCNGVSVFGYPVPVLVWWVLMALLAASTLVSSMALLLGDARVMLDVGRFLQVEGFKVVLYFSLFSLTLLAVNGLILLFACRLLLDWIPVLPQSGYCRAPRSHPFDLGLLTFASLGVGLWYLVRLALTRGGRPAPRE